MSIEVPAQQGQKLPSRISSADEVLGSVSRVQIPRTGY